MPRMSCCCYGGCDTDCFPCRSSSCKKLMCPTVAVSELVSLPTNKGSSPDDEEEVVGEGSGFTREYIAASTDCGQGEEGAIVMRTSVCIFQAGSGTGGASTIGVNGERKMSSTSSTMGSYSVDSIFRGTGEPSS